MNRYQQEVAEIDRRHARFVRSLSFIGAASLVALALWSAGLLPANWWAAARGWFSHEGIPEQVVGSAPAQSVTAPVPLAPNRSDTSPSVPRGPQPLHLVATTLGRNKHEGTARIGTSRDNPQTYVAGALLANGSRIAEIHSDHVVLERGVKRVDLYLDNLADKRRPADDLMMVGGPLPPVPVPQPTREVLTDYMRPSPVFREEALHGYQVYPGRKAGVFAQLGLRPGDVITSINDAPLLDTASAIELLKEITNGTSIVVSVERNGKATRLVLDGTLITTDIERETNSAAATPPGNFAGA